MRRSRAVKLFVGGVVAIAVVLVMIRVAESAQERRMARTLERATAWATLSKPALVDQSKLIGDRIVTAILHYRAAHGRPPTTLMGLVPEYLSAIPAPSAGLPTWEYGRFGNEFNLAFGIDEYGGGSLYPKYFRQSNLEGWQSDF